VLKSQAVYVCVCVLQMMVLVMAALQNHYPLELAGSFVGRQATTGLCAVISVVNAQQWDVWPRTGWRAVCEELAYAGRGTAMDTKPLPEPMRKLSQLYSRTPEF
jgi:hypothetical protein